MKPKEIYTMLTDAGYKLTNPRKEISKWIAKKKGVFSAPEIYTALKNLDRVSVYRTLELFCKLDIIHTTLSLHGEQHYEVHEAKNHHHHIVCTECEKNECIPCELPQKKFSSFKKIHHTMVFTGLCNSCAT